MSLIHLIVGKKNAASLINCFTDEEVFPIDDLLNFGPLKSENQSFTETRNAFWNTVSTHQKPIDDLERLMELSTKLSNEANSSLCYWMNGTAAEICTYFWLLHFLKKHKERLSLINISGLPFIDESGKLFYPITISDLSTKEIRKAKKLARHLTTSEWEINNDEWNKMRTENAGIRILKEGKALRGMAIDFYDNMLFTSIKEGNQNKNKMLEEFQIKNKIPQAASFLNWRFNQVKEDQLTQ